MNNINLSIIVIGYNVEKYIEKCLNSILKQLREDCEIIFVDDGSSDRTQSIVKKYNNVKYIYQTNSGANSARIKGYLSAKGKFVTFVDSDDMITDTYIEVISKYFESEYDIITYNYITNDNGKLFCNKNYILGNLVNYQYLEQILNSKIPHYLWNKVYRRDFLIKIKFHEIPKITMGDDLVANIFIGTELPNVYAIEENLYVYNYSSSSVSRFFNSKFYEIINMLEHIELILSEKGLKDKYNQEIEYQYFKAFVFYVVRNKFDSDIPKEIYLKYKTKRIKIQKNKLIKQWMKKRKNSEKILIRLYLLKYDLGKTFSRLYLKMRDLTYEKNK